MQFSIDAKSGVPFYRQIIDRVKSGISRGELSPGDQLPTVRRLAVELSVNPNTVTRAYREMEIEGILETQQGSGTFVGHKKPEMDKIAHRRMLDQILTEMLARGSGFGFTLDEMVEGLLQRKDES